ncbi:unnamed protein product [Closterium sp. Naga37s-1]|nr:unnamed protein product [Closterium sp. Naga37s-1]
MTLPPLICLIPPAPFSSPCFHVSLLLFTSSLPPSPYNSPIPSPSSLFSPFTPHPHRPTGGALGLGNTGPVAEFNIQCDPEAASIVFNSGCPLTMVPLEVTHTALLYPSVAARISSCPPHCPICAPSSTHAAPPPSLATIYNFAADATQSTDGSATAVAATTADASLTAPNASAGSCLGCYRGKKLRQTVSALMHFFARTYLEVFGFQHPPLHDPCALAFVIAPSLFKTEHLRVDIETKSEVSHSLLLFTAPHRSSPLLTASRPISPFQAPCFCDLPDRLNMQRKAHLHITSVVSRPETVCDV